MKAAAIVNPHAGAGRAWRRWPAVARSLEARLGALEVRFTEGPGHAMSLAREAAAAGFDPVIAAGGDGTLNEVANGILAAGADVRLGMLPLASAGDFARTIGLAGSERAIEVLVAGQERRVDVVRARCRGAGGAEYERYFLNAASAGLGAEVASGVRARRHILPGRARYLAVVLPMLAASRGHTVRMWTDCAGGPLEFHATTIAFANGRYQGGGILIAPEAALDDGLLDITLVEYIGLGEVVVNLRLLYSGAIYSHPKVHQWRLPWVRVEAAAAVPVELDGEVVGTLPFEAEVLPRKLRLIVPERE